MPWGVNGSLELKLPAAGPLAEAELEVVWPDLSDALVDYPAALEQALESPVGSAPLEHQLAPGASVAIVVDDPSRWTPVREALPIVLRRLHAAGVGREDVTICVGVGRHAAVDAEAMRRRLGDSIAAGYRCFSPPVDDLAAYADLGQTPDGVPVRVFRPVAEASLRILISSVLPHLQAGFGGGYKLIFPGTSHRSTLGALHRQGLDGRAGADGLLGDDAAGNPMRQAIQAAAASARAVLVDQPLGRRFGASLADRRGASGAGAGSPGGRGEATVPGTPGRAGGSGRGGQPSLAGRPHAELQGACFTTARPAGPAACWPACSGPTRMRSIARSRSARCVGSPRRAVGEDGRSASSCRSPSGSLRHRARPAAFMLHWARELVVDRTVLVYAPPLYERIGPRLGPVCLFADQASLWQAAAAALQHRDRSGGTGPLRIRIFPQGGLTYVPR